MYAYKCTYNVYIHMYTLMGQIKLQFFQNAIEKREQYNLRSNFLDFEKTMTFIYFNKLT